ncbi:MAG: AAA family ATPase, partial [Sphaerochaeta sp.]
MIIQRDRYLKKLIERKENGLVKVITGIRRCGKSVLLNTIYHDYLLDSGVKESQMIMLALDQDINAKYRNPLILGEYIRKMASQSDEMHYVFLDEIQKVAEIKNPYLESNEEKITFVDTLLGLMAIKNIDLYVTGSNSKMLSSDILT